MPFTARARAPAVVCVGSELPPYASTAGTLLTSYRKRYGTEMQTNLLNLLRTSDCLRIEPCRSPIDIRDFAYVGLVEQDHQHAAEAKPETSMGRASIFEEIEIELDGLEGQPLLPGLRHQDLIPVFALRTRRHLNDFPQQVKSLRHRRGVRVPPVVKGPYIGRVIGAEHKPVPDLTWDIRAEEQCASGI